MSDRRRSRGRSRRDQDREGRSPVRREKIEEEFVLQEIGSLDELHNGWKVVKACNSFTGVAVHVDTLKKLGITTGSLVCIHPIIYCSSGSCDDSLPIIVVPIYVSNECSIHEIEMKKWQRETLRVSLGYNIQIIQYLPSSQNITLEYTSNNSKSKIPSLNCKELKIHSLDTAELVTVLSVGSKPLSDSIHTIIFSKLLKRRFVNLGSLVFISFFGQSYSFRIIGIRSSSSENFDYNNYSDLKSFIVHSNTSLRVRYNDNITSNDINATKLETPIAIGGLTEQVNQIENQVNLCLYQWKEFSKYKLKVPRGILLFGPPGTGKTLMVKVLAKKLNCSLFVVNGPEIMGKVHGESESKIRDIFDRAIRQQPSIIFIDEIDAICSKRQSLESEFEKRLVSQLLSSMDQLHNEDSSLESSVIVLAATNRPNSLDPALRRPGRFDREIEIGIPNPQQRLEILNIYLSSFQHSLNASDIEYFANSTHGYVGADLASLCRESCIFALLRNQIINQSDITTNIHESEKIGEIAYKKNVIVNMDDMKQAMIKIRPSAMRELMIEVPKVSWNDIGGNEETKQKLKEAVEWPLLHPEAFERMGIRPPKGILLYGPPGCSKTMMAKALATEAGLNFIAVKGPELFSKWVGESERAIRELFRKARAAAPSIVFFDEIDALAIKRGGSDAGGVADRVLSQLLTELDGVEPLKKVTVVAATNRPDIIDKALMRPGRIDRIIYVGLPDENARKHIFEIHLSKIPSDGSINIDKLVEKTISYSGAEVVAVCKEASMFALMENIDIEFVTMNHFELALEKVKPRISKDTIAFYDKFKASVKI